MIDKQVIKKTETKRDHMMQDEREENVNNGK